MQVYDEINNLTTRRDIVINFSNKEKKKFYETISNMEAIGFVNKFKTNLDDYINLYRKRESLSDVEKEEVLYGFKLYAGSGDPNACYWLGTYYLETHGKIHDKTLASQYLKIAADYGLADAQLRFAFMNLNCRNIFLSYLTMSAFNGNATALFNLGDVYYNGKLKVEKNINLGEQFILHAAKKDHPIAKKFCLENNIYSYN